MKCKLSVAFIIIFSSQNQELFRARWYNLNIVPYLLMFLQSFYKHLKKNYNDQKLLSESKFLFCRINFLKLKLKIEGHGDLFYSPF